MDVRGIFLISDIRSRICDLVSQQRPLLGRTSSISRISDLRLMTWLCLPGALSLDLTAAGTSRIAVDTRSNSGTTRSPQDADSWRLTGLSHRVCICGQMGLSGTPAGAGRRSVCAPAAPADEFLRHNGRVGKPDPYRTRGPRASYKVCRGVTDDSPQLKADS